MCKETGRETEQQIAERFDRFVRDELLKAGNELRAEKGWPLLTEDDLEDTNIPVMPKEGKTE